MAKVHTEALKKLIPKGDAVKKTTQSLGTVLKDSAASRAKITGQKASKGAKEGLETLSKKMSPKPRRPITSDVLNKERIASGSSKIITSPYVDKKAVGKIHASKTKMTGYYDKSSKPKNVSINRGNSKNAKTFNIPNERQASRLKNAGQRSDEYKKLGAASKQFNQNVIDSGGWKKALGGAGSGAIAGGVAGAGINTIRGEDAWEGARTGATMGAFAGGGIRATRMGTGASANQSVGQSISAFNNQTGVSKSVQNLMQLNKDVAMNRMANFKKR